MKRRRLVNSLLMIFFILMMVSGFLIHPLKDYKFVVGIHVLSALVFCVLCLLHILQYRRRKHVH